MPKLLVIPPTRADNRVDPKELKPGEAIELSTGSVIYRLNGEHFIYQPDSNMGAEVRRVDGSTYEKGIRLAKGTQLTFICG